MSRRRMGKEFYILTLLVLVGIAAAAHFELPNLLNPRPCMAVHGGAQIVCYQAAVNAILARKGFAAGVDFAKRTCAQMDYNICHQVSHMIGHAAYHEFGGFDSAFAYGKKLEESGAFGFAINGYMHGIMLGVFSHEMGSAASAKDLMKKVCAPYIGVTYVPETDDDRGAGPQCFHAVGHGMMATENDEIAPALADCSEAPYYWQRLECDRGAFMEHTYEFFPGYATAETHATKAQFLTASDCAGYSAEEERRACSYMLGREYIAIDASDEEVFGVCLTVAPEYRARCVEEDAMFTFPLQHQGDPKAMVRSCETIAPAAYEASCMRGLAYAMLYGVGRAASSNDTEGICSVMPQRYAGQCASILKLTPDLI